MILEMGEELPILKGILNGVVKYHNARRCPFNTFKRLIRLYINSKTVIRYNGIYLVFL